MAYISLDENKKVKRYIDRCGMKHCEIYPLIGLTKFTFSDRYKGKVRWKTSELKRLAEVVGCSFYDFME